MVFDLNGIVENLMNAGKNVGSKVAQFGQNVNNSLWGNVPMPDNNFTVQNPYTNSSAMQSYNGFIDNLPNNIKNFSPYSQGIIQQKGLENIIGGIREGKNSGIPEIANSITALNDIFKNEGLQPIGQQQDPNNQTTITAGTVKSPSIVDEIMAGYKQNANQPFSLQNFAPDETKTGWNRAGEFAGSLARIGTSPLARGALMYGIAKAGGAGGGEALGHAASTTLMNQQANTNNKLYRNALENEGIDTTGTGGYISGDTYKNLSNSNYRYNNLDLRRTAIQSQNRIRDIDTQLKEIKLKYADPTEQAKMEKALVDAKYQEEYKLAQIYALQTAPQVALGNLGYTGMRTIAGVENTKEKTKTQKIKNELLQDEINASGGSAQPSTPTKKTYSF